MLELGVITAVLIFGVLAITLGFAARQRQHQLVNLWMEEHGFELIECHRRLFWNGPFTFRTSKSQAVFRVKARDKSGVTQSGHVRVGGYFLGILSDQVTVVWDDL